MSISIFFSDMRNWFKQCFFRKKSKVEKEPYFKIDEI